MLLAEMAAHPFQQIPVIVQVNPVPPGTVLAQSLVQQAIGILNTNGHAFGGLAISQGAAGVATAAGIQVMSQLPQVATIELDAVVTARRPSSGGPSWSASQLTSLPPQVTNATRVWAQGGSGRNVGVAVLDSGVYPDVDLSGRIVASASFAGSRDPANPDKGGHGTHIAGTIASNGAKSNYQFMGMAPNANIIDVQVIDQNGHARISSVLAGLDWVIAHKAQYNIRVVNLSLGAPSQGSYRFDPMDAAVEVAWKNGIVIVAASGNRGPGSGTVESPGNDPLVITVGSTDDQGTLTLTDDTVGWWSSWGTPTDSTAKPDVVAPSRRVVSTMSPGSTLATSMPDHIVAANNGSLHIRLTGTSTATAVVSGEVALMLEHHPSLSPDDVKKVLLTSTQPFGVGMTPASAGAGMIDAFAAWNSPLRGSPNLGVRLADDAARTLYQITYGQPLGWKDPGYLGRIWPAYTWATLPWDDPTWDNIAWDNIAWDNIAWDNIAWDNIAWDNIAWDNIAWDNAEWDNIAWDAFKFD